MQLSEELLVKSFQVYFGPVEVDLPERKVLVQQGGV